MSNLQGNPCEKHVAKTDLKKKNIIKNRAKQVQRICIADP